MIIEITITFTFLMLVIMTFNSSRRFLDFVLMMILLILLVSASFIHGVNEKKCGELVDIGDIVVRFNDTQTINHSVLGEVKVCDSISNCEG